MSRKRSAFTLVELLVVIGIIALLIAILLPALNRARAHANLIDCQSRLRQMGQAAHIYAANNKDLLPWGYLNHGAAHLPGPDPHVEQHWKWYITFSELLGTPFFNNDGTRTGRLNPIFVDKDTVGNPEWGWNNHYTANPRILHNNHENDVAPVWMSNFGLPEYPAAKRTQRKIGSISEAAGVMMIWDGRQGANFGWNARETAANMDGWQWFWGHCYVKNSPHTWISYDRPLPPGDQGGGSNGKSLQQQYNKETLDIWDWDSELRFRHMGNTTLNALFVDGHVEARKIGEVLVRDICTNYQQP